MNKSHICFVVIISEIYREVIEAHYDGKLVDKTSHNTADHKIDINLHVNGEVI